MLRAEQQLTFPHLIVGFSNSIIFQDVTMLHEKLYLKLKPILKFQIIGQQLII